MRKLLILPAVLLDIAEAATWYDDNRNSGVGDRLIATFYSYLPEIQECGGVHRRVYRDFHKILIRPFPYSTFYKLHNDVWVITLVIHAARRPSLTRKILRERQ